MVNIILGGGGNSSTVQVLHPLYFATSLSFEKHDEKKKDYSADEGN
jgi:hypothetical protein